MSLSYTIADYYEQAIKSDFSQLTDPQREAIREHTVMATLQAVKSIYDLDVSRTLDVPKIAQGILDGESRDIYGDVVTVLAESWKLGYLAGPVSSVGGVPLLKSYNYSEPQAKRVMRAQKEIKQRVEELVGEEDPTNNIIEQAIRDAMNPAQYDVAFRSPLFLDDHSPSRDLQEYHREKHYLTTESFEPLPPGAPIDVSEDGSLAANVELLSELATTHFLHMHTHEKMKERIFP